MELLKKRTMKMTDPDEEIAGIGLTVADILTFPLVTDCIFNHLEYSDLLSCSLVSQAWNFQARDYLRRQRTSLLKYKIDDLGDSLQPLLDHLSNDNYLNFRQLFTGVHVCIEEIEEWKLDVEMPNDLQSTTRSELTKLFGLFPIKHLIVTARGYRYDEVRAIYFPLEFIFPLLPEGQLETLKITGLVLTHSADLLWARLPIKGSSKLKTVQMGRRVIDLPRETKPVVGHWRWRAIREMVSKEKGHKIHVKQARMRYLEELAKLKEVSERQDISEDGRGRILSRIEVLTAKLQDLNEPET